MVVRALVSSRAISMMNLEGMKGRLRLIERHSQIKRFAELFGMIIKMADDIGKQLTYAALEKRGMSKHEIPKLIAFRSSSSNRRP